MKGTVCPNERKPTTNEFIQQTIHILYAITTIHTVRLCE